MSESDPPKGKKPAKRLPATQHLKRMLNFLLYEEGIPEKDRARPEDTAWIHRMLKDIDSSRMSEAEAANIISQVREGLEEPSWTKKTAGKRRVSARQELREFLTLALDGEECPPEQRPALEQMLNDLNSSKTGEAQARYFMDQVRESLSEPGSGKKAANKPRGPYRIK